MSEKRKKSGGRGKKDGLEAYKDRLRALNDRLRMLEMAFVANPEEVNARRMGEYGINPSGTQGSRSRENVRQGPVGEFTVASSAVSRGFEKRPSGVVRGPTHNNPMILGFKKPKLS